MKTDKITSPPYEVICFDKYLSQSCIEECINVFNNIPTEVPNPVLKITAQNKVEKVDVLLIAYFTLFKKRIPKLEIILDLTKNKNDDITNTVGEYQVNAHLTSGENVFSFSGNISGEYPYEWFVLSSSFIPNIFIDKKRYQQTFIDKISFQEISKNVEYENDSNLLYQKCRKFLYNQFQADHKGLEFLSQLAFYNSLDKVNLLNLYLYKIFHNGNDITSDIIKENKIQVSNLHGENAFNFYTMVSDNIFKRLLNKPPIYQFIYSTLLSSKLLLSTFSNDNSKTIIDSLNNLLDFTNELVVGLFELAKNIIEHSSLGHGIITGRVYLGELLTDLTDSYATINNVLLKYQQNFLDNKKSIPDKYFNINVIDDGEVGVVNKLKNDLDKVNLSEEDKEDIRIIDSNKLQFINFLDPDEELVLNQQAKRATAHLGLLNFSRLILDNSGMLRASTWKTNIDYQERDHALIPTKIFKNEKLPLNSFGTNYQIILPFNQNASLRPRISIKYEVPFKSSLSQIQSIESLLSYRVQKIIPKCGEVLENGVDYLIITGPSKNLILTKDNEHQFWKDILDSINTNNIYLADELNKNKRSIVCIDFDEIEIDGSQLFRLLGKWELQFPGVPLIIFNISTELYFKLSKINTNFYRKNKFRIKDKLPYWNENSLVIIYSRILPHQGMYFYFTDCLWGGTKEEFLIANQLISKTNYNSTIRAYEIDDKKKANSVSFSNKINDSLISKSIESLSRFGVFQNGVTLLPYDLLLTDNHGLTLFEQNAMVLLKNEMISMKEVS